jgi:hypothetical protein
MNTGITADVNVELSMSKATMWELFFIGAAIVIISACVHKLFSL